MSATPSTRDETPVPNAFSCDMPWGATRPTRFKRSPATMVRAGTTSTSRFSGPFPRPLDSPLAKSKRRNHDLDRSVIALRVGHESVKTTQMYLYAELRLKEEAHSKVTPLDVVSGRFRPADRVWGVISNGYCWQIRRHPTPAWGSRANRESRVFARGASACHAANRDRFIAAAAIPCWRWALDSPT